MKDKPIFTSARMEDVEWMDAPIPESWVLNGEPRARVGELAGSSDGWASSVMWQCSAGGFRWRYIWEETIVILEGGVRITTEDGVVRQLAPGDVAYFAPGTSAEWQIDDHVKKIAFSRGHVPAYVRRPLLGLRQLRARLEAATPARKAMKLLMAALGLGGSWFLLDFIFA